MKRHRTALKHQITDYFHSIGIETSSAQVRLIPSIQDFWINLLKLNTSPYICVENYHDTVLSTFFKSLGLHVLEMPLTPTGMDLDTLEQTLSQYPVAFICVSSYIQNPTGICYDLPTKKRLLELAHRYHCYIVDDLTCIDFSYLTSSVAPLFSLDTYDEVITLYHFCKLYLPILTYSFAALPVSLSKQLMGLNTYTLNEHLLAYYLRSDFFAGLRPHLLEQSRTFYLMIREALSQLTEHVLTYALDGGLSFFIRPTRLSTEAFIQHFLSFGIVISPGEVFVSNPVPPWFRLAIAPLDNVQCLKLKACLLALDTVPAT